MAAELPSEKPAPDKPASAPASETVSETWFSALRSSLYVLRVPIVMAIVTVLAMTTTEQAEEVFATLAKDPDPNDASELQFHWSLAVASLVGLAVVLWQVARGLSYDYPKYYGVPHPVARWVLAWVPRLLVTVPLLGAALGLWLCISEKFEGTDKLLQRFVDGVARLQQGFYVAMGVCIALAIALFVAAVFFERRLAQKGSHWPRRVAAVSNWLIFPIIAAGSVALIARDDIHMSQYLGVIPIFALWMAILAMIVGLLARLSLFAIPVLGLVVVYGLGIEYLKRADNHAIRAMPGQFERQPLEIAYKEWLSKRKDFQTYKEAGRPYPVYIVAAEGGGLYAAYQTARFLARMQDLCPSFAQHVFTISSVSGGSLGAAVFAGLVAADPKHEQPAPCVEDPPRVGAMERQVHDILDADFLSPAVWGALFPDFLQRFIPKPIFELDRAVVLERAFERAWPKAAPGANPMTRSFFDLCGPNMAKCLSGATPLLAMNVTNVETGLQMVVSPVGLQDVGSYSGDEPRRSHKIYDFFGLLPVGPIDMALSTAVGLSARFPWLSPPGWIAWEEEGPATRKKRLTFVDGGYVDNSGVATALNIAQHLGDVEPRSDVEFRIIMISALFTPLDRVSLKQQRPDEQGGRSGEFTPPIQAAINARQGRGFKTQYDAALEARRGLRVTEIGFYYGFLEPPLGWQLSDVSRRYIRLFRGRPERCPLDSEESYVTYTSRNLETHKDSAVAYIQRADCVVATLKNELTPRAAPLPPPSWPPINPTR